MVVAAVIYIAVSGQGIHLPTKGIVLAVLSGAITSGAGYAIWYSALRGLTATQGGVVQLSVPIIAALGGVMFVSEPLSFRLALSAAFILGGIALTMLPRKGA